MTHRIQQTTISGQPKFFIELKRNGRWQPVRSYGEVKSFDSEQHATNYVNAMSKPKVKSKQLSILI